MGYGYNGGTMTIRRGQSVLLKSGGTCWIRRVKAFWKAETLGQGGDGVFKLNLATPGFRRETSKLISRPITPRLPSLVRIHRRLENMYSQMGGGVDKNIEIIPFGLILISE